MDWQFSHRLKVLIFIIAISLSQACGPPHGLELPEDAWIPEKMPQQKEYVMVVYEVKGELLRLLYGEAGLRWKVLVHFKDGEIKEYWAYLINGKSDKPKKFYAPIPMTMKELQKRQARIILLSHDQKILYAHWYLLCGFEFRGQIDDKFDWSQADLIQPSDKIFQVIQNSKQDWTIREQTANEVAKALRQMDPVTRQRVEALKKNQQLRKFTIGIQNAFSLLAQYGLGYLWSNSWWKPLISLSVFESQWLLGLLLRPNISLTPEYFGSIVTHRWFAEVMYQLHQSMSNALAEIRARVGKLEDENIGLRAEIKKQQVFVEDNTRRIEIVEAELEQMNALLATMKKYSRKRRN